MITKEIYQIGGSGFSAPEDAAAYLIYMDGRAAIVDSGCGNATERLLDLNADILCEGHYGVFHGKERVREFIGSFID